MGEKNKIKFRSNNSKKKFNSLWMITISIVTFFSTIVLGYISLVFMDLVNLYSAVGILLIIVFIGIFFDALGIAVTAAEETPFHSMAANRVDAAKESIILIRNAGSVANFFNDVIGDICGIISGAATGAIILKLNQHISLSSTILSILLSAIVAASTVGGKALGKEIALSNANSIVYKIAYFIYFIKNLKKLMFNRQS